VTHNQPVTQDMKEDLLEEKIITDSEKLSTLPDRDVLVTLREQSNGDYGPVNESVLFYVRMREVAKPFEFKEEAYYFNC